MWQLPTWNVANQDSVSANVPGLPACRASGMSAGPGPPRFVRYPSPAAAPRQAARAGTLLLSEVRRPVLPAGARSPVAPPTLPALHRQPQHAAALATPHPSTGSAPPRLKGAGPRKAGALPPRFSCQQPTHRPTARDIPNTRSVRTAGSVMPMLSRCARARTCLASCSTTRSSESRYPPVPRFNCATSTGGGAGETTTSCPRTALFR
jgi:hypothetical protein